MNNNHSQTQAALATIREAERKLEALVAGERRELDIAALIEALGVAAEAAQSVGETQSDAQALRKDITERICAMERAIQVVRGAPRELLDEALSQLERCSAVELIKRHRSACARFRDTFPATALTVEKRRRTYHDWSDYSAPVKQNNAKHAG